MVTRVGADKVAALIAEIDSVTAAIASITGVEAGSTLQQINLQLLTGAAGSTFILKNNIGSAGTTAILNAIKTVLQSRLTALNTLLAAIT